MKRIILGALVLVIALITPNISFGKIKLTALFTDNMILQQQTKNTIWGWSNPGNKVTVKASWGARSTAKADENGKWQLLLDTPAYGTGFTISISDKDETVEIKNVAIGEVWLAAGQSNMGFAVGSCFGAEEEAKVADMPDFRIFRSSREHWHEPLEQPRDLLAKWKVCTPEVAARTSAVTYYFGKKLHQELGIPVGVIQQAYAGTPIEGWMPEDIQVGDKRFDALTVEIAKKPLKISKEDALAKWEKQSEIYQKKIANGETMKNKTRELKPPTIVKPAIMGHQIPSHIFNAMINPIRPYGIKGAIWYQGERNSKDAAQAAHYRYQIALLINYYRTSWNEMSGGNVSKDFPFQITQLPSWHQPQSKPVEGVEATWSVNREMMRLAVQDVENTSMVVTIDTGDSIALHPKNKKPIGIRHAYQALKNTYGKDFVADGPSYKESKIQGNKVVIRFDKESVGSGLIPAKAEPLNTFAIAGADQKWHWAKAEIKGNAIVLSSKEVSKPVAVRYAWGMNPSQRNLLYNKEGLPASPFRTDDWSLYDPNKEVRVTKPTKEKKAKGKKKEAKDWDRPVMTQ